MSERFDSLYNTKSRSSIHYHQLAPGWLQRVANKHKFSMMC